MKKNVLVFGLISGLLISTFMVFAMTSCYKSGTYEGNMIMGFSAMILALSLMFVAVKNYRDKYNGGVISFGKAFQIGFLVALIASTMYMLTWAVDYHYFLPGWMDGYTAHMVKELQSSGKSAAEIAKETKNLQDMKEAYKNPLVFAAYTYLEILPVGIIVALITALILKRKNAPADFATA
ncbi:DUF4199 domain-containing protein [Mucilaginibacter pedocola]|uniref:DUF4199 domain-containing protein n=1 Tax=Mucilaginibacter pedocola TaxID=1792845 RepID=A0A1S9PNY7_9SPHI|nr:DUF4199 domain-containing protein [Mucilaginibacter pedocola]OOQ62288.1 hypothetical protein BC343_01715 [Mucilaginibacter pedocola]